MNRSAHFLLPLALLLSCFVPVVSQSKPPAVYVDRGACPFECCTYRKWKTAKTTVAYSRPDRNLRRVGTFRKGTWVVGLTGTITTVPSKFIITNPYFIRIARGRVTSANGAAYESQGQAPKERRPWICRKNFFTALKGRNTFQSQT